MESGEPDEELPAAKDVILGHVKVMKEILLEYFPGGKRRSGVEDEKEIVDWWMH